MILDVHTCSLLGQQLYVPGMSSPVELKTVGYDSCSILEEEEDELL